MHDRFHFRINCQQAKENSKECSGHLPELEKMLLCRGNFLLLATTLPLIVCCGHMYECFCVYVCISAHEYRGQGLTADIVPQDSLALHLETRSLSGLESTNLAILSGLEILLSLSP